MYEVVRYRSLKAEDFKEVMQLVFDQHTVPDDGGIVRGGDGKLLCLVNYKLSTKFIRGLVKTPCRKIIEEMRSLFRDLYRDRDAEGDLSDAGSSAEEDESREQDQRVVAAREKLQTSVAFLAIIERHLASEWSVDNDGSRDSTDPQPDHSASRNRKRKADEIDSEQNIHLARIGRMPPNSRQKIFDTHSSQTSGTSDSRNSLFSVTPKVPSSGLASSKSLGSRNNGPLAKR